VATYTFEISSAFAGDHGLARGGQSSPNIFTFGYAWSVEAKRESNLAKTEMRKSSAATADSATKLSADEPGEAEHESISAKTGHLNRDHGFSRGAPY